MKNHFIQRCDILNLYSSTINNISTHSISEWLKSKTDKQFVVMERAFIIDAIKYIELNRHTDSFLGHDLKDRWNLKQIKDYI